MRENLMSGSTGAGNGATQQAICGSRAGVLRNATTMARSGPSPLVTCYRASALPYLTSPWDAPQAHLEGKPEPQF